MSARPFLRNLWSKRLARNSAVNIVGQATPLLAAIFTFPVLVAGLGEARFGALSLAWLLVGYASIFDFGLGRALTQMVARSMARDQAHLVPKLIWTTLAFTATLGSVAAVAMFFGVPALVARLLSADPTLTAETVASLKIIALFLPLDVSTPGIRGVLEAHQKFVSINLVRIPVGILNYVGPVLILPFSTSLVSVVWILILLRFVETLMYLVLVLRLVPELKERVSFDASLLKDLFSFGGWMTVSNIIAPIMLSFDRFVIASLVSLSAVAYYVTPYTLVTKLRIVPAGLMSVFFPDFAERTAGGSNRSIHTLYYRSMQIIASLLVLPTSLIVWLAKPGITLWLGAEFSANSFRVAQLLALGIFVHSLGQPSFTLLQAAGRPDITAKLHLIEVPLYVTYLLLLIHQFGVVGAAAAWLIRVTLSSLALGILAHRTVLHPPFVAHREPT